MPPTSIMCDSIQKLVEEQGKHAGGPWDCYEVYNFYGWEAERVVAVTDGGYIMELITRAKTQLSVILVEDPGDYDVYTKKYFQQAEDLGLVEIVQLSTQEADDKEAGGEIKEETKNEILNDYSVWFCVL